MKFIKYGSYFILASFFGSIRIVSASYIIPNGAVTTAKIASQAVTNAKVAANAIGNLQLQSNSVATANIQNNAVTFNQIAPGSVGNFQLANNSVATANIQANAVTSTQIAAGAVGNSQLASNSVATGNIQANAVTSTQIAAGAVGTTQIATQAVTQDKLAPRPAMITVGLGGVIVTASSGLFAGITTSPTNVTNLSGTITTSGRPVFITLSPDGTGSPSYIGMLIGIDFPSPVYFRILRNGSPIAISQVETDNGVSTIQSPPGSVSYLDVVGAGTYTYSVQTWVQDSGNTSYVAYCELVAYEL